MTLPGLKEKIEKKELIDNIIILECEEDNIVPFQYASKIAHDRGLELNIIHSIEDYPTSNNFMFDEEDNSLYLCNIDCLDEITSDLFLKNNLIISCNKINKNISKLVEPFVIKIPKLLDWQLKDYIMQVLCGGLTEEQANKFVNICNGDSHKILCEIDKLVCFPPGVRKTILEDIINNSIISSVNSNNTIFDLITAIQHKEIDKIRNLMLELNNIGITSMGLAALLHTSFKNIIKVWLSKKPTEENTGLKNNQIWAISKLPRLYSKEQVLSIFKMLSNIDCMLKNGIIPENLIIDYMVTYILSV